MDASKLHFQAVMVTLQTRPSPSSKKKQKKTSKKHKWNAKY